MYIKANINSGHYLYICLHHENDHLNSQSEMSCHFSLSWHCQRILGWGWLAGAGVPTHPMEKDRDVSSPLSCEILLMPCIMS